VLAMHMASLKAGKQGGSAHHAGPKGEIDSHLGLKVRKSKRQKDHEMQLVS